jgi:hypothetical protein
VGLIPDRYVGLPAVDTNDAVGDLNTPVGIRDPYGSGRFWSYRRKLDVLSLERKLVGFYVLQLDGDVIKCIF